MPDAEECVEPIRQEFGRKWGIEAWQDRLNIMDFLMRSEMTAVHFEADMLVEVCRSLRNVASLDHYGVCIDMIMLFVTACPGVAVRFFQLILSSAPVMSSFVLGKKKR